MVRLLLKFVVPLEAVKVPAWRVKAPIVAGVAPAPKLIVVLALLRLIPIIVAPSGMVKLWSPAPLTKRVALPPPSSKVESTTMVPLASIVPVLTLPPPVSVRVPATASVSPEAMVRE